MVDWRLVLLPHSKKVPGRGVCVGFSLSSFYSGFQPQSKNMWTRLSLHAPHCPEHLEKTATKQEKRLFSFHFLFNSFLKATISYTIWGICVVAHINALNPLLDDCEKHILWQIVMCVLQINPLHVERGASDATSL